jgi:hypothetical protein
MHQEASCHVAVLPAPHARSEAASFSSSNFTTCWYHRDLQGGTRTFLQRNAFIARCGPFQVSQPCKD